jgi:hypothetical protein
MRERELGVRNEVAVTAGKLGASATRSIRDQLYVIGSACLWCSSFFLKHRELAIEGEIFLLSCLPGADMLNILVSGEARRLSA